MKRYWIAINGSSCALCGMALFNPQVTPTPETLIGFKTYAEAKAAQATCLNAPIPRVHEAMQEWVERGAAMVRLAKPEPQTTGPTLWEDAGP